MPKQQNNLENISKFINNTGTSTLLINEINEEIGSFYLLIVKHFSRKENIQLNFHDENTNESTENDLFGLRKINIYKATSLKIIKSIIDKKIQKIIFTDYKTFKKFYNEIDTINGYDYISDIKYFVNNILEINDKEVLDYCLSTPHFIYSETSKYLTNPSEYLKDTSFKEEKNFILEIRKAIFNFRKNDDTKKTFLKIKEEAQYKKFNFLVY